VVKVLSIAVVLALAGQGASAQTLMPIPGSPQEQVKARANMSIMEGVLERAVRTGADNLNRRVREMAQDTLMVIGAAQARGFRLEGYGIMFDVEVPMLRQSVAWSLRTMLDQSGLPLGAALEQMHALVRSVRDPHDRQAFEQALRRIELQVGPTPGAVPAGRAATTAAPAQPALPPSALEWLNDPNGTYTSEVKGALIDAMLDHSGALGLKADEWLTVAARDNEPSDRMNQSGDDLSSIVLRIKGSDLAALHAGRLTAEEARKRVEVREY
jgi:hypothetical protein